MKSSRYRLGIVLAALALITPACGSGGDSEGGKTTLTFLYDNTQPTVTEAQALVAAFEKANPDIDIETETRPGGTEGDNVVKTRLSTGDMTDVFWYNSGSLLQALNPGETLVDLTGDPVLKNVEKEFLPVVSQGGKVYGVPADAVSAGGILYNRKVYDRLGLEVPKTWAEFMANNQKIKAAGVVPVISTFKDTWTSQLFVLGDFYNVQAAVPNFARDYTAGKAKYATTPAALNGFRRLADVHSRGFMNKGFGSAVLDDGLTMLTEGKGAHYPILTNVLPPLLKDNPDIATDIGFFGIPGDDPAKHGATIWEPVAIYAPRDGDNIEAAKRFMAFVASPAGAAAVAEAVPPTGPYRVVGAKLPDDAMQVAKDVQAYIDDGASAPALEFVSPVKGPSLEQITVAVGSGQTPPAEGAAQYDKDVEKQAKQLGLPGWE